MGVHMFPILNPSPTFLHPIPLGHPSAPAPSTLYHASNLDWQFISHMIFTCFNDILPNHPILTLSHRVQKTVVYICVSFAVSVQFSSVAQSCPTLCDPLNHSRPGLPVHHHLLEFTQTHVHRVRHAIQPSHSQSCPSPPVPNPSQHQSLFQ